MAFQKRKRLKLLIFVFIFVIVLGVGYAGVGSVDLLLSGNSVASTSDGNFVVKFKSANISPSYGTASITNDITATINVTGLSLEGDMCEATYTVKNESRGIDAGISLQLVNTNAEYFRVTETIADSELQVGDTTTVKIKVEMIKTPVEIDVSTNITGVLHAVPRYNASGTAGASIVVPDLLSRYAFSTDNHMIGEQFIGEKSSFDEVTGYYGHSASLAFVLGNNNIVDEAYVVFKLDDNLYFVKYGDSDVYNYNVDYLKSIFGDDWANYCGSHERFPDDFYCSFESFYPDDPFGVLVMQDGSVFVVSKGVFEEEYGWYCGVENDSAYCIY